MNNMHFEPRPLLSVAMGVRYYRNDLTLLEHAVRSILEQTYSNFEFLICQNDSTVSACQMLKSFAAEDSRIHLIDGLGADTLSQKLNRCIAASNGSLIARQDDDDISEPERLEKQIEFLFNHPEISFVGCQVKLMQGGKVIGIRKLPERPTVQDFLFTQPFIHPTLLFRKKILDAVGGYCEERRCNGCEDYDLLLRFYEKGYFGANLPQPLFLYTLPPKGISNRAFGMRINETKTRFIRFQQLGLLPKKFPYVVKPVIVGMLPATLIQTIKNAQRNSENGEENICE